MAPGMPHGGETCADPGNQMAEGISHHCKTLPFTLREKGALEDFFFFLIFIYLAVMGLSFGVQASLVVVPGFSCFTACGILAPQFTGD